MLVASERNRTRVKQRRADWLEHRIPAIAQNPQRVVFIDETSVKTNLTRLRGRGQRLEMHAPFGSWGTQTLIAGLSQTAFIAPCVIKSAMDGSAFATYVRDVLIPKIEPGTDMVLDNLATHRNEEAAKALRVHGCWFLFLPPYSPDLNPIEMAFSKLKAHLRCISARSFKDVFDEIAQVCELFDRQQCSNYFNAAGYKSN